MSILATYLRAIIYSYMNADEQLNKIAVLNKQSRKQLIHQNDSRSSTKLLFKERTVKIVVKQSLSSSCPTYILNFADMLIIQSVVPFKGRTAAIQSIFREMPSRLNECRVKLFSNELSTELINQVVKQEIKLSVLLLCDVTAEYTDRLDSMLKSTRNLRIYRSTFRQIFPKCMQNDTCNDIETLHFEDVDFRVENSVFNNDRLKVLSLCGSLLRKK